MIKTIQVNKIVWKYENKKIEDVDKVKESFAFNDILKLKEGTGIFVTPGEDPGDWVSDKIDLLENFFTDFKSYLKRASINLGLGYDRCYWGVKIEFHEDKTVKMFWWEDKDDKPFIIAFKIITKDDLIAYWDKHKKAPKLSINYKGVK